MLRKYIKNQNSPICKREPRGLFDLDFIETHYSYYKINISLDNNMNNISKLCTRVFI